MLNILGLFWGHRICSKAPATALNLLDEDPAMTRNELPASSHLLPRHPKSAPNPALCRPRSRSTGWVSHQPAWPLMFERWAWRPEESFVEISLKTFLVRCRKAEGNCFLRYKCGNASTAGRGNWLLWYCNSIYGLEAQSCTFKPCPHCPCSDNMSAQT